MMQQPSDQSHSIAKNTGGKVSKRDRAKLDRQKQQEKEAETLSTFLSDAGDQLTRKDDEIIDGLTGIARRQGSELMTTLAEKIPAAYAEGINEAAKEATGAMSDNFRASTERFSANLREVFGVA